MLASLVTHKVNCSMFTGTMILVSLQTEGYNREFQISMALTHLILNNVTGSTEVPVTEVSVTKFAKTLENQKVIQDINIDNLTLKSCIHCSLFEAIHVPSRCGMLFWDTTLTYLLQSLPKLIQTDFPQNPNPAVSCLHLMTSQSSPWSGQWLWKTLLLYSASKEKKDYTHYSNYNY